VTSYVLQITAGTGPVEVRQFVAALAAHLEVVAGARGLTITERAATGASAQPRSIALYLDGDAPAVLADQLGTHALIARSRRRGRAGRKRWFAAVALHPATPPRRGLAPPRRADLIITACRASGPGGQHVNKVSSAVRVEHVPTGLTVRCASERSQHANLARALARLTALLDAQAIATAADAARVRRLDHHRLERGRAIATYTLDADRALRLEAR
jgi:putative peptide chain release factor H